MNNDAADPWLVHAGEWIRWARTPGHDAYWHFAGAFLEHVVPAPSGRVLDVGCGEGRMTRDLAALGHTVIGVDRAPSLVTAASQVDPRGAYLVGDASALPFPSESFDLIVGYNSLMDVEDLAGSARELGRVLRPGGVVCASIVHPFAASGSFDADTTTRFVVEDSYFDRRTLTTVIERDGLSMTFRSFHRTLQDYTDAVHSAGLTLTDVREPRPNMESSGSVRSASAKGGQRMPMFLHLRAEKPETLGGAPAGTAREDSLECVLGEWLDWFQATFEDATPESFLRKVLEETEEFLAGPSLEELSDVIGTLIGWLDLTGQDLPALVAASRAKLETNRARTWRQLPDGRYKHLPDKRT